MMLGKTHHLFDRAEQAYQRCIHLIRTLDQAFQSEAFRDDPEERYDTRITLRQFDVILQAILLNMALIDGDFHRLERRLIDKLTRYGDLLDRLRQETDGGLDLSWDKIQDLSPEERTQLLDRLPELLDQLCTSFVRTMAMVDGQVDSIDFLERLERELREIALSLSDVDGQSRPAELQAYTDMLDHLLTDRWKRIKEDAREFAPAE